MSGVKHTPVSGVHPDNTALRAVDACGGAYTSAEEADGWANGHRNALASAMVAVGRADSITAALLDALEWAVRQVDASAIETQAAADKYDSCLAAIARARGEQDGGGE